MCCRSEPRPGRWVGKAVDGIPPSEDFAPEPSSHRFSWTYFATFLLTLLLLHAGYHAALAWYNDEGVDQKVFHRVIDEQRELFTWVGSKMSEKLPPLEKLWDSIKVYAVAAWEYVATKVSEFDFASTKKGVMEGVRNATRNVQEYLDEHLD